MEPFPGPGRNSLGVVGSRPKHRILEFCTAKGKSSPNGAEQKERLRETAWEVKPGEKRLLASSFP